MLLIAAYLLDVEWSGTLLWQCMGCYGVTVRPWHDHGALAVLADGTLRRRGMKVLRHDANIL